MLDKRFPSLAITSAAKETDAKGEVVYDIELKQKDRKFETDIKGDGIMLEVEKEIFPKQWSKALAATVEAKYPFGKIREVLEVDKVRDGKEIPDHLEITIETADKKSAELLTSLDGKSIVTEEASEPAAANSEENVKVADLPRAVVAGLRVQFPKAEIKSAEKGIEDGKPIYEISIHSENRNIDVTLSPAGKIVSMEKTLPPADRPKSLLDSLAAKYPHATIKLVEEVWENDVLTGYEATIVTAEKKSKEVDFDAKGKLVEESK